MSIREQILRLMVPGVKLTADEIAGALDRPRLSVRPRVTELYKSGLLSPADKRSNRHGNICTVWERYVG